METAHTFDKPVEDLVLAFRQSLRDQGYTSSTIRSYSFYVKDFLGWLDAHKSAIPIQLQNPSSNHSHLAISYGLHLKEERKATDSAVSQALIAVTIFVRQTKPMQIVA